jgi:hypothetical protein
VTGTHLAIIAAIWLVGWAVCTYALIRYDSSEKLEDMDHVVCAVWPVVLAMVLLAAPFYGAYSGVKRLAVRGRMRDADRAAREAAEAEERAVAADRAKARTEYR